MELKTFNEVFQYTPDGSIDSWRILTPADPSGDCDDYAITVAYIEAGGLLSLFWGLLTLKYVPWFVWDKNGVSHVALWVRGKGWIDNWYMFYSSECRHTKRWPIPLPIILLKLLVGKFTK